MKTHNKTTGKEPASAKKAHVAGHVPNPRRVAAGRRNQKLSRGLTDVGREKLRQAIYIHKPWLYTTGPRTPEGKAKVSLNGKKRQLGPFSVRELRRQFSDLRSFIREIRQTRAMALGTDC